MPPILDSVLVKHQLNAAERHLARALRDESEEYYSDMLRGALGAIRTLLLVVHAPDLKSMAEPAYDRLMHALMDLGLDPAEPGEGNLVDIQRAGWDALRFVCPEFNADE